MTETNRLDLKAEVQSAGETIASNEGRPSLALVIVASSTGTLIEWYDFYLYGVMGVYLGRLFFPQSAQQGMLGLLLSMATLGLGFAIRPLGGLIFGSMGDRLGRKYSFLFTLLLMGFATTCMGLLPTFNSIGYLAPFALLILRIVQGLAVGGEVGGAVTYIVENAPPHRRCWFLGILYAMSPAGTLLALGVVYLTRTTFGSEAFDDWAWRLPFLLSALLVLLSLNFRMRLRETKAFELLQKSAQRAKSPALELFRVRENRTQLLLAIFGSTAGQSALGITAFSFSMVFMQTILKIDIATTSSVSFFAFLFSVPFYLLFGWISDYVGRRVVIILGMLIAIASYGPIYHGMQIAAAPPQFWPLVFYSWVQLLFVALVLPATMASVAELFPTKVRSTGVGVTYNVGNGLLNGLSPLIGFSLIAATGSIYVGLAYPIALAALTAFVSARFVQETAGRELAG